MAWSQIQGGNLPLSESDGAEFLPEFDRFHDLKKCEDELRRPLYSGRRNCLRIFQKPLRLA